VAGAHTATTLGRDRDLQSVALRGRVDRARTRPRARERWQKRYDHIRAFEQMLVDEGTTIVKFFLHVSKEEQKLRLQERINNPAKRWKFSRADLGERKLWDEYAAAFEDMLTKTSTKDSPWYAVPADRNWYRNLVVSQVLVDTLRKLDLRHPPRKKTSPT
jgi:polyphosphate kinase 2 (PPK2 family)